MEAILRSTSSPSIAAALELVVASISNPTELNAIGTAVPDWRLCRTNVAGSDEATLYRLDTSSDSVNAPYIMASLTAGLRWVAITGRFQNDAFYAGPISSLANSAPSILATGSTTLPLGIFNNASGGGPAASGTQQTLGAWLTRMALGGVALDIGVRASGVFWLQTNLMSDLTSHFGLELNPLGGSVRAGTTTSASSPIIGGFQVGDGVTSATSTAIGGGNINSGANITAVTFGTTGSFTPTIIGTGGGSAHTYVVQTGQYIKVGKRVDFSINVAISAKDGTMTGPISIGGLPFAQSAGVYTSFASVLVAYMTGVSLSANYYQIAGYITTSASQIQLLEHGSNLQQGVPPANIAAATQLLFSGSYYTDS